MKISFLSAAKTNLWGILASVPGPGCDRAIHAYTLTVCPGPLAPAIIILGRRVRSVVSV